ncbi:hypothetical protein [Actinoplanes oblitus]|uniref:hypothetical protein n=1 Tax=Actinoplanes oblitus TaxID=3040509 RepID=UPI003899129C
MGSTGHRRSGLAAAGSSRTRLLAIGAAVVAVGGAIGFTQLSRADEAPSTKAAGESGAGKIVNGQKILTDTCVDSKLTAHDGFQKGDRCVSTEFGEVASAANDAALLITESPREVAPNTPFTLKVSTRNLIRDRFLAAGKGGYYVESSVLQNGLVRGHFHTACRMLASTDEAPTPEGVPAFFVATEDSKGGRTPDTVTIQVPGMPTEGTAQCASWAGDGSHRTPMMERANQTPAIDAVRITVRAGGGNQGGGGNNGGDQGGNNGGDQGGNTGGNTGDNNTGGDNNQNTGGNTGDNNTGGNTGDNNTGGGQATATPRITTKTTVSPGTTRNTDSTGTGGDSDDETTGTTKSTTKSTPAPSATTKAPTTKSTKSTSGNATTSGSDSDSGSASDADTTADEPAETTAPATKKPKPQVTESEEAPAADYGVDGGAPDQAAPASTADDVQLADPPAGTGAKGGPLTLLSDHPAWFGGGAVLVLLAIIGFAFTRSRPRRY